MDYDQFGREIPDPRPVEVPTHLKVGPSLNERIQQMIRSELSNRARMAGAESFEDADDFDVDDEDGELVSPYEVKDLAPERMGGKDASDLERAEPPAKPPDAPVRQSGIEPQAGAEVRPGSSPGQPPAAT